MKLRKASAVAVITMLAAGLAASASASAAESTNWKVKGKPLAPGESRAIKLRSIGPIDILVPEQGLNIGCKKSKGAGVIVGAADSASFGTGRLSSLSFTKCGVEGEPGCELAANFEVLIETDGELLHPSTWTVKVEVNKKVIINARAKPKHTCSFEGTHSLTGSADSSGPHSQEIEFPLTPLPGSTLQLDGRPAVLVGTYKLKAKGGTLEF
jgi:hypothetical protein